MVRIFVSHSSDDVELAELVVQLLSTALGLRSQHIRCTSVDGYRLPGGADSDEQLRNEALAAESFIGILSPQGLASAYVLFELGARWGAKKPLVPLLAPGMKPHSLKGPLTGLNALSCDSMAELHQLIHELGQLLGVDTEPPAVFQRHLEAVVYYATTRERPVEASSTPSSPAVTVAPLHAAPMAAADEEYAEADEVIDQHCEREWPEDYSMRAYCIDQQQRAVAQLREGKRGDIPEAIFKQIRRKCAREWPDDYSMRQYCEEQQFAAYRRVRPGRSS